MMIHQLKTLPVYYNRIAEGTKTFEVRYNDRDFQTGDRLYLAEYDPVKKEYTDRVITATVTYVLNGGLYGIVPDYVVMGIKVTTTKGIDNE